MALIRPPNFSVDATLGRICLLDDKMAEWLKEWTDTALGDFFVFARSMLKDKAGVITDRDLTTFSNPSRRPISEMKSLKEQHGELFLDETLTRERFVDIVRNPGGAPALVSPYTKRSSRPSAKAAQNEGNGRSSTNSRTGSSARRSNSGTSSRSENSSQGYGTGQYPEDSREGGYSKQGGNGHRIPGRSTVTHSTGRFDSISGTNLLLASSATSSADPTGESDIDMAKFLAGLSQVPVTNSGNSSTDILGTSLSQGMASSSTIEDEFEGLAAKPARAASAPVPAFAHRQPTLPLPQPAILSSPYHRPTYEGAVSPAVWPTANPSSPGFHTTLPGSSTPSIRAPSALPFAASFGFQTGSMPGPVGPSSISSWSGEPLPSGGLGLGAPTSATSSPQKSGRGAGRPRGTKNKPHTSSEPEPSGPQLPPCESATHLNTLKTVVEPESLLKDIENTIFEYSTFVNVEHAAQLRQQITENSARLRQWCIYEWFYSNIDQDWFNQNDFMALLQAIHLAKMSAGTKAQWNIVRQACGKPRRLSKRFFDEERAKLKHHRKEVRGLRSAVPLPTSGAGGYSSSYPHGSVVSSSENAMAGQIRHPDLNESTGSMPGISSYGMSAGDDGFGTGSSGQHPETLGVSNAYGIAHVSKDKSQVIPKGTRVLIWTRKYHTVKAKGIAGRKKAAYDDSDGDGDGGASDGEHSLEENSESNAEIPLIHLQQQPQLTSANKMIIDGDSSAASAGQHLSSASEEAMILMIEQKQRQALLQLHQPSSAHRWTFPAPAPHQEIVPGRVSKCKKDNTYQVQLNAPLEDGTIIITVPDTAIMSCEMNRAVDRKPQHNVLIHRVEVRGNGRYRSNAALVSDPLQLWSTVRLEEPHATHHDYQLAAIVLILLDWKEIICNKMETVIKSLQEAHESIKEETEESEDSGELDSLWKLVHSLESQLKELGNKLRTVNDQLALTLPKQRERQDRIATAQIVGHAIQSSRVIIGGTPVSPSSKQDEEMESISSSLATAVAAAAAAADSIAPTAAANQAIAKTDDESDAMPSVEANITKETRSEIRSAIGPGGILQKSPEKDPEMRLLEDESMETLRGLSLVTAPTTVTQPTHKVTSTKEDRANDLLKERSAGPLALVHIITDPSLPLERRRAAVDMVLSIVLKPKDPQNFVIYESIKGICEAILKECAVAENSTNDLHTMASSEQSS